MPHVSQHFPWWAVGLTYCSLPHCPQACPCPLHPGAFASSTCVAWPLCSCPGGFPQSRGYQAVVLCHHLSVRPLDPPLLESCGQLWAKLPRGPTGSSCMSGWALWWPCGQVYVTGVAGGVAAGTAGAQPLSVASVEFVGSVLGWGGWFVVFLNKCTKESLGLLSWSVG